MRFPVCLPGLLEKQAAEFEERIHLRNILPHAWVFDAPRSELLADTLNRARADEVALLPIGPIVPAVLILLKVVQNGCKGGTKV